MDLLFVLAQLATSSAVNPSQGIRVGTHSGRELVFGRSGFRMGSLGRHTALWDVLQPVLRLCPLEDLLVTRERDRLYTPWQWEGSRTLDMGSRASLAGPPWGSEELTIELIVAELAGIKTASSSSSSTWSTGRATLGFAVGESGAWNRAQSAQGGGAGGGRNWGLGRRTNEDIPALLIPEPSVDL